MLTAQSPRSVSASRIAAVDRRKRWVFWATPALAVVAVAAGVVVLLQQRGKTAMAEPIPAPIDGQRAYGYLKQICALGPRISGTDANTAQRKMVSDHFKKCGATVTEQTFDGRDPQSGEPFRMVNLKGSWFPDRADRVVIAAHYDTRPTPDRETDPALMDSPFLGANDGASGVALLMEIAHHLKDMNTPWGVDLVIFDGEERVYGRNANIDDYFLGSKAFSRAYQAEQRRARPRYRYARGIILDMVGDADLNIEQEGYSRKLYPRFVAEIWDIAKKLGATGFADRVGTEVNDDHLPMINAGIPTIDLIDFDYPHWHRATDLPENCSARSLEQVGRVVTAWLNQPKPAKR